MLVAAEGFANSAIDVGAPVQVRADQDLVDCRGRDPKPVSELDRACAQTKPQLDTALRSRVADPVR